MACGCKDKPGVGADTTVIEPPKSSGPGFWTGLAFGVLTGGALATLLYVGYQDEKQRQLVVNRRRKTIQQRRAAGYAY